MPSQPVTTKPGTIIADRREHPAALAAARSPSRRVRATSPAWICGTAEPIASNIACTSPARSAECAAGVPR